MHSSFYLDWRSSLVCSQSFSEAYHGTLACFLSSSPASFSGFRSSSFWQGFCESAHELLTKETREQILRFKQPFCRLCCLKKKAISEMEGCEQFWSCCMSSIDKRSPQRSQRGFTLREFLFPKVSPSSHKRSYDTLLLPRWFLYVKKHAQLTVISILLSQLMWCPLLGLNTTAAVAHASFQSEVLDENILMESPKMEGKNIEREEAAEASDFVQYGLLSTKETPMYSLSDNGAICEEAYGLFPCSNSLPGNFFLMLAYGYLLLMAARLISEGSELLLEVMNPGVIGGLLLPVLGALPDAALICASGVGGTVEEAQQEVLVGVGVLAGSTTLILTLTWAGSLFAGRCDLSGPGHTAKELTLTHGFDLFRTGITTDQQTRWGALIMIASGAPYVFAQLPLVDKHPEQGPESVVAGCILAFSGMVLYCCYQIASPWLQQKKIEEARLQYLRTSALQGITAFSANQTIPSEQAAGPSDSLLQELFTLFDKNDDGKIEQIELRGLILGLNIEQGSFQDREQVEKWFKEFDVNTDGMLSETEFLLGIRNWANRVAEQGKTLRRKSIPRSTPNFWGAKFEEAKQALNLLESELEQVKPASSDDEQDNFSIDTLKIYQKSVIYLICGAALAAIFSDPLIDSIQGFSNASHIPSFFVAFIVVPFASNASEVFSSISFARKRRKRNISLTFSQIYGSVTMNNTLCLGIFLGIVYARGLTWDFSSEVTVVLLNILIVGLIGASRVTFPLWFAIPVFSLYFISLGGVALLDNLLGWH